MSRSLRILLIWIIASILLVSLMGMAYSQGLDDGVDIGMRAMWRRLHPSRAALRGTHLWPHGAMLDARLVRRGRVGAQA